MKFTKNQIEEWAANPSTVKNGSGLISKFINFKIDNENTIIWGECQGSGKNPYFTSADFINGENPVFRCNCPSRQFPCKHGVGLLLAFEGNTKFEVDEIPQEIVSKRSKINLREEKKKEEKTSLKEKAKLTKKVNENTLIKRIDNQLTGIENAKKILNNIVQSGLSTIDNKENINYQIQIKDLGNYYINGIQTSFNKLILELNLVENENFTSVINQVNYLNSLLKKAEQYLSVFKENPNTKPEINSAIEEQIGTIWKLTDLISLDLYEENAELIQLSFVVNDDIARKEIIETGIWLNLKTGKIYQTKNLRPYNALKYIKEENSEYDVLQIKELYIYPGDANPRIRWEINEITKRKIEAKDFINIHEWGQTDYKNTLNEAKNTIKNPLMSKNPFVLLKLMNVYLLNDDLVIEDSNGQAITLTNLEYNNTAMILKSFLPEKAEGLSLLASINNNLSNGILSAMPYAVIAQDKIIKLIY